MDNNVVNIIVSILTGIATAIPLIVQLVKYVKKAIQEKNWNQLVTMVMNLMEEAEKKFTTGAERKEWCLAMVKASADSINYPIDLDAVSALIDSLCDMSKIVNGKK
uniref:Holin n=1 Tax=Siphoviridae sp. ctg6c78 TaxID=2825603 RepID=A0A8S5URF5_9CAUD|nr:MAG TPA: holin [Siphoviridae sp. ctg6c78]